MSIKTEKEELEKDLVLLKVEVPSDQVDMALKRAYHTLANKMNLPGFRRGKVPRQVIDQRLGKEYVYQEMVDSSVPLFYKEALKQAGIDPIDKADIEVKSAGEDGTLVFEAKIPITPRPLLCEYKNITVDVPKDEVTDEDVDKRINEMQSKYARFESVSDDGAKENDLLLMDMDTLIKEGERPVKEGQYTDYLLEIGRNQIGLDIEMKLIGIKKGEVRDVPVEIPADFDDKKIAGKEVLFRVTAKDVKRKVLPELNDEFAQNVSEFDSLGELKADIKQKLVDKAEKKARDAADQKVVTKIIEGSKIDVPEILIEHRVDAMMKMFEESLKGRGLSVEEYLQHMQLTIPEIRTDYERSATEHLQTDIVLREIAHLEDIKVTDEDVDTELKRYADSVGRDFEHVKTEFAAADRLDEIRENIAASRALEFLSENSSINYVEKTDDEDIEPLPEDLLELAEGPTEGDASASPQASEKE